MAAAIPACRLVTAPGSNHYTVPLGETPEVKSALAGVSRGRVSRERRRRWPPMGFAVC